MAVIKICPFCGNAPVGPEPADDHWWIECEVCEIIMDRHSKRELIEAWNKRTLPITEAEKEALLALYFASDAEDNWSSGKADNWMLDRPRVQDWPSPLQPCGHPTSEIVSSDEGASYCGACEREAKDKTPTLIQSKCEKYQPPNLSPQITRHHTLKAVRGRRNNVHPCGNTVACQTNYVELS